MRTNKLSTILLSMLGRVLKGASLWVSVAISLAFAVLTLAIKADVRADMARATITVAAPVEVGLFAIVVAALTLFAALTDDEFRRAMPKWPVVLGVFLWAVFIMAVALLSQISQFLLSYVDNFVASNWFVALGVANVGLFSYSVLLAIICGHNVARQMLGIAAMRSIRFQREKH